MNLGYILPVPKGGVDTLGVAEGLNKLLPGVGAVGITSGLSVLGFVLLVFVAGVGEVGEIAAVVLVLGAGGAEAKAKSSGTVTNL